MRSAHITSVSSLGVLALATVAIALLAPAAAAADTLTPRFSIERGRAWTNERRVAMGDRGWSPFFVPGVAVWDGGSIIGGYRVPPELKYSVQTLRLVPHTVRSFESWSAAAILEDMIAAAPVEVDAHHRTHADANVCVVMGGCHELAGRLEPAVVHEALAAYCLGRQAAGFQVVVMTLLPRDNKPDFEAARQALNALVRTNWPAYADGLADIAADDRIGDARDCLDLAYYQPDALHPNAAGDAVMAAVTAPVLSRLTWRSNDCAIRARNAGDTWTGWLPYAAGLSWRLESGDGVKRVDVEYRDGAGTIVAASDSIGLDTAPPVTRAPVAARARRGRLVTLRYRVDDLSPCGPRAQTVRIQVRAPGGAVVKRIKVANRPVNTTLGVSFTVPPSWRKGIYVFRVFAVDDAGNVQAKVGSNTLTVR